MRLANLRDEDLQKISLLKTRKGCATSEAKRAQQILYTRNISHGGFYGGGGPGWDFRSHLDGNITRERKTFEEEHGCTLEEYLQRRKK